ncbi:alpha/beta fold hydrolase [Bacillaceae bacterium W0354]
MIIINKKQAEHIPLLEVVKQSASSEPLPVVIYFHGFTSSKEQNLAQAYLLADQGYRVILPDSLHHGERDTLNDPEKIQLDFWKIVFTNVKELHMLYNWLTTQSLILDERIGIAGTSMGGITVSAALTKYDWIKAAGIMMGSAKLEAMGRYLIEQIKKQGVQLPFTDDEVEQHIQQLGTIDLSKQLDRLNHRPLFIWHGEDDLVVPYQFAKEFVNQLKEANYPEDQYQFITEKNRDHKVSRVAMHQLKEWFIEKL